LNSRSVVRRPRLRTRDVGGVNEDPPHRQTSPAVFLGHTGEVTMTCGLPIPRPEQANAAPMPGEHRRWLHDMECRGPGHRFDSHAHSRRSTVVKRSRGRRERFAIANWCRSARISKCRAAREQTNNRSEWRTETTTDTMDRAYSARLTISIVTRRTAFLVGTGCAEISLAVTGWARTRRVFRSEVVARPSVMTRG